MPTHPIRTYSQNHPQAGYLEFTIPIHSPQDVEAYLSNKLSGLSPAERLSLANKLLKQANEMWSGYALWVGDPVEARLELRQDKEIMQWLAAMVSSLNVGNTITLESQWEATAKKLFAPDPVGVMERVDGTFTIFARVVGYVDDPTYGKLIQVERVDAGGERGTPPSKKV